VSSIDRLPVGYSGSTGGSCSDSSPSAIINAYDQIAHGRADLMVTGGAELAVTEFIVSGFVPCRLLCGPTRPCPSARQQLARPQ